ncbi:MULTISPECIES: hypothetical protein [unclassified Pseudomonas]|uniref:hypothetical protein n=1 Tax=unclassified Pseudomonas TaxID=196821 RepID=UPI00147445EC|nr:MULTISPECIES: hypothetical protein [unclassified Pseudomonas]MBJ2224943.1 hypothetical protein [Pseudomonas sp. MF7451]NMY23510.1 hypothetical protein [Pseudomonas sp. WS 5410]
MSTPMEIIFKVGIKKPAHWRAWMQEWTYATGDLQCLQMTASLFMRSAQAGHFLIDFRQTHSPMMDRGTPTIISQPASICLWEPGKAV